MNKNITLIYGDCSSPEIVTQAVRVLDKIAARHGHTFTYTRAYMGGEAIDRFGDPLPASELEKCKSSDSVLLGAIGGPKWEGLPGDQRPEKGLLRLRAGMGLYANNRPAKIWPQLADASPLKKSIVDQGIDFIVVRELIGGVYFGEHKTIEQNGEKVAIDTMPYSEARRDYLPSVIGDVDVFKRNLLASMPKPKFADYMADSLVWLCTFALVSTATYTVMGRPWDCHYDAVWLVLCIAIMMPSAWLLQRIVPAEWAASTEKGVRYGAITAAMMLLWFVEFWLVDKWITPLLPAVGLPNLAAVILFGAALAALLIWRNHRRNELAEKRPWRDVMEK